MNDVAERFLARCSWHQATVQPGDPCVWCGALPLYSKRKKRSTQTRDHLVPRSHGGVEAWSNLAASCQNCNQTRGDVPVLFWLWARDSKKGSDKRQLAHQIGNERRLADLEFQELRSTRRTVNNTFGTLNRERMAL